MHSYALSLNGRTFLCDLAPASFYPTSSPGAALPVPPRRQQGLTFEAERSRWKRAVEKSRARTVW